MYEIFEKLLEIRNVSPYAVSKATGIATSTLSDWKNGKSIPKTEKLKKIAEFLGCSLEYLTTGEESETYYLNEETKTLAQFYFDNPEYRILFDASRKVKPEDLKKAVRAIGLFVDEEEGKNGD